MQDKATGASKGFGFVSFDDAAAAKAAIEVIYFIFCYILFHLFYFCVRAFCVCVQVFVFRCV